MLYYKSLVNPISTQNTKNLMPNQGNEMETHPKKKLLGPEQRSYQWKEFFNEKGVNTLYLFC